MSKQGKAGCGCLVIILVFFMVIIGVLVHPLTLKLIGNQFKYEDKIFPSDAIFVPRFVEDRNGELYIEAFREYWAGNGKTILIEEDKVFGTSIVDLVLKMAKTRGVKEAVVKKVEVEGEGKIKIDKIKEKLTSMGFKKVIILVPEYASKRFHLFCGASKDEGKVLCLIKAVNVTYFKRDKWWKDSVSRGMLIKELFLTGSYYLERFKYGEKRDTKK